MTAWLDENCGADGWAMTPSETRGVLNDAASIYFIDTTLVGAFVGRARPRAGRRPPSDSGQTISLNGARSGPAISTMPLRGAASATLGNGGSNVVRRDRLRTTVTVYAISPRIVATFYCQVNCHRNPVCGRGARLPLPKTPERAILRPTTTGNPGNVG
jgi:hypothetical protein